MKYLNQILDYLVDISLEEYFVFLILDEKSILRRGYASRIGGVFQRNAFLTQGLWIKVKLLQQEDTHRLHDHH